MIRKAEITSEQKVLIASGTSNTSMFLISLLNKKCQLYVLTSSQKSAEEFRKIGIHNVSVIDHSWSSESCRAKITSDFGKLTYDVIFDPFIDSNLNKLIHLTAMNGKYITCGIFNQSLPSDRMVGIYSNEELIRIFSTLIQRNVQLLGNCLGSKEDLIYALSMFVKGEMPITIDSVYQGSQVQDFFNRTFNESNRFGKVVYIY